MKAMRLISGINIICYIAAIVLILTEFWQGPENLNNESIYTEWILLSLSGILLTSGILRWAHKKKVLGLALFLLSIFAFTEGILV